jgi:hypothetical protein
MGVAFRLIDSRRSYEPPAISGPHPLGPSYRAEWEEPAAAAAAVSELHGADRKALSLIRAILEHDQDATLVNWYNPSACLREIKGILDVLGVES